MQSPLRSLLGRHSSAVNVLVDIRGGVELPGTALDALPDLARSRGRALGSDEVIDAGLDLAERVLDVAALREARTQEGGVDGQQDPRPALEQDGGEQQTDPEEDLEAGDDRHGCIVV